MKSSVTNPKLDLLSNYKPMQKVMRANKKREHINGLVFDLQHFRDELQRMAEQKEFTGWWLGNKYTRSMFKTMIDEHEAELKKIHEDKNYKPWKD